MNSTHCSKLGTAFLCAALLFAAAGTAAAFSTASSGVPDASEVGSEVTVTYTIDDPFTGEGIPNNYTLHGETELRDVQWTVTVLRAGTPVEQPDTFTNQSFDRTLRLANGGDEVEVRLTGTVPTVGNYTYEPRPTYEVTSLSRVSGNNTQQFVNDSAAHYTSESREARTAIESARDAIEAAGGHQGAADLVDNAISAYESEDFGNAVDLANNAEQKAQTAQRNTTILMGVGGLIVVLALLGGGYYLYQQTREDEYSKL